VTSVLQCWDYDVHKRSGGMSMHSTHNFFQRDDSFQIIQLSEKRKRVLISVNCCTTNSKQIVQVQFVPDVAGISEFRRKLMIEIVASCLKFYGIRPGSGVGPAITTLRPTWKTFTVISELLRKRVDTLCCCQVQLSLFAFLDPSTVDWK